MKNKSNFKLSEMLIPSLVIMLFKAPKISSIEADVPLFAVLLNRLYASRI